MTPRPRARMTGAELERARARLGMTAADLGRALHLGGRDPGQQVRRWETDKAGAHIPGPVGVAVGLMLEIGAMRPRKARASAEQAQPAAPGARVTAPEKQVPAEPQSSGHEEPKTETPEPPPRLKTRRRG